MAKKVRLGDILQVLTSQGVAYVQVTHKHPEFGFLIRVFPGFHNEQPKDFSAVVDGEPQFSAFFVVQSAVNQGLLSVVANVPVPKGYKCFLRSVPGMAGREALFGCGMEAKHFGWRERLARKS